MFSGLSRTDDQDVLRAVGLFLNAHGYRNPRLIEQEDGVIIQALPHRAYHYEIILLSEKDLRQIISGGFGQRGTGPRGAAEPRHMSMAGAYRVANARGQAQTRATRLRQRKDSTPAQQAVRAPHITRNPKKWGPGRIVGVVNILGRGETASHRREPPAPLPCSYQRYQHTCSTRPTAGEVPMPVPLSGVDRPRYAVNIELDLRHRDLDA